MSLFKITSLISKITWSPIEQEEIRVYFLNLANNKDKQVSFFSYCKQWKLAPWTCSQLNKNNLLRHLDVDIQQSFRDIHAKTKSENEKRNKEALRFLRVFRENSIEVIILKGNLFAHTVYKDSGYKKMNDFDMLIHEKDWDKIQDIYLSLGYIPLGFGWSSEKEKVAKFSHVGMSFISPDFSCITGSQWGLKSPTTSYKVNIEEAWATATDFDFYGCKVKQLSPEYNLLHLVLHMGIYKCGIRDCMDVYNLLLSENVDQNKFKDLAQRTIAVDKTFFTLKLTNFCSGTLDHFLDLIKPSEDSFLMRRLHKREQVFERSKDFQDSYNDYFQDIEKIVIYFNLFPKFHKKIIFYFVILKFIFFPKKEIVLKLADDAGNKKFLTSLKARCKAPYLVFSLIAQEIGWKFTFLLFLKLFIDLIISLKNYFVKKDSYFDYLKKRNIDPKSIQQAVKNIQ